MSIISAPIKFYAQQAAGKGRRMLLPLLSLSGEHRLLDVKEIVYLQTNGEGKPTIYSYDDEYKNDLHD